LARSTGLEYWYDAGAGSHTDPRAIERILSHANFERALRHSVTRSLAFFREETEFNISVLDLGTFFLGFLALYLHTTGGLTHSRLADVCGTSRVLSAGRASAILFHLRSKGFVRRAEKRSSDRTVIYTPAPRMMGCYRERNRIEFEAEAMIEPAVLPFLRRLDEPGIYERFLAAVGRDTTTATKFPDEELADITAIGTHRAGHLILYQLVELADDGGAFPPVGTVNISISTLAEQFRVSRTHIRRVLEKCMQHGLLAKNGGDASYILLPKLRDQLRKQTAILYAAGMRMVHFAMESWDDAPQSPAPEPKQWQPPQEDAELSQ
jgi:hypothetical protein